MTSLAAVWRRCVYGVETPGGAAELRVDERAPLLDGALPPPVHTWALVTAHNPGGAPASNDDNRAAEARLDATLAARGLTWWPSSGGRDPLAQDPSWTPEPSRLVLGLSLVDAHTLARDFGQAAFLFGCRGAPAALVFVAPSPVTAARSLETVAWVRVGEDGRVLMARPAGKPLWFMPGGKKEPGEDDVTALARELHEELAVSVRANTVRALFIVEEIAWGREDTVVRMACYAADVDGAPVPSGEIEAVDWLGPADGARMPPAGRAVVTRISAG